MAITGAALVTAAKPLDGAGLQPPHADPIGGVDAAELRSRATQARQRLESVVGAIDAALAGTDPDALRAAVVSSWTLGVGEAGLPSAQSGWAAAAGTGAGTAGRPAALTAPSEVAPCRNAVSTSSRKSSTSSWS